MNTPQYLPPDMVPPVPAMAPSKDEELFIVVHTRMEETEKEIKAIVERLEEEKERG